MKIFVANWKMNFTIQQALEFCQNNRKELKKLKHKLILCPSYPALTVVSQLIKDTDIAIAAQGCSAHESGPYTGQVSAKSLAQAGCSYVLVGHSEERAACKLSNEEVAQKTARVFEAGMIPIVCIGEPAEIRNSGTTKAFLEGQLKPIKEVLKGAPAYIAYEPVWAIGSDQTPTAEELKTTLSGLKAFMAGCAYFYGGSVTADTIKELNQIEALCGFLIGGASLKFSDLQKIMKSC